MAVKRVPSKEAGRHNVESHRIANSSEAGRAKQELISKRNNGTELTGAETERLRDLTNEVHAQQANEFAKRTKLNTLSQFNNITPEQIESFNETTNALNNALVDGSTAEQRTALENYLKNPVTQLQIVAGEGVLEQATKDNGTLKSLRNLIEQNSPESKRLREIESQLIDAIYEGNQTNLNQAIANSINEITNDGNKNLRELTDSLEAVKDIPEIKKKLEDMAKELEKTKGNPEAAQKTWPESLKEWFPWLLLFGGLTFAGIMLAQGVNLKTGCTIFYGNNDSEKLHCGPDDNVLKKEDSFYHDSNNRYYCSCGSSSFFPTDGSAVDCSEIKITGTNSSFDSCTSSKTKEMGWAPYCIGNNFGIKDGASGCSRGGNDDQKCTNWAKVGGGPAYCKKGAGKNGWTYGFVESNPLDIINDALNWLGNLLGGGLNFILKWVLIIMGVILGGSLVFFIAKKLITATPTHKKNNDSQNSESVNINLSTNPSSQTNSYSSNGF